MKNDVRPSGRRRSHRRTALPEASRVELPRGCLSAGRRRPVFGLASLQCFDWSYSHAFPPMAVALWFRSRLPLRVSQSGILTRFPCPRSREDAGACASYR
jgi:hypothetical protein